MTNQAFFPALQEHVAAVKRAEARAQRKARRQKLLASARQGIVKIIKWIVCTVLAAAVTWVIIFLTTLPAHAGEGDLAVTYVTSSRDARVAIDVIKTQRSPGWYREVDRFLRQEGFRPVRDGEIRHFPIKLILEEDPLRYHLEGFRVNRGQWVSFLDMSSSRTEDVTHWIRQFNQ